MWELIFFKKNMVLQMDLIILMNLQKKVVGHQRNIRKEKKKWTQFGETGGFLE